MDINTINQRFQELLNRINKDSVLLTHLDLLRIQLVYTPSVNDKDMITEFTAQCWSKLAVYNGVYCNIGHAHHFEFNRQTINDGDFLVKLPDNQSLRIPGSSPYYYKPTEYNVETTQLTFQLIADDDDEDDDENIDDSTIPFTVPQWATGNPNGHVCQVNFDNTGKVISNTWPASPRPTLQDFKYRTRYFINNEEIILPPNIIKWPDADDVPNIEIALVTGTVIKAYVIYHT